MDHAKIRMVRGLAINEGGCAGAWLELEVSVSQPIRQNGGSAWVLRVRPYDPAGSAGIRPIYA